MPHDILIVDDEADIRMLMAGLLEDEGYTCREAADSDTALKAVAERRPSLVILDIWLQGSAMDGLGVLEVIKAEHPHVPVLMISGHGTIETAVSALKKGAYDFIEKPFKSDRLLLLVERAVEAARLRRENEELRGLAGAPDRLMDNSPVMSQLRAMVDKVAPTGSRVLLTGPPGGGKELVARLIHGRSRRADRPFVVVNCATTQPDRMALALFGEEPTGAQAKQPRQVGLFEEAHGGTLYLDEVADIPPETQGWLVRVLQENRFTRVGGRTTVPVDVRVIAATAHDLMQDIQHGRFREDLYYRLNVVPIRVPGLRERREDIPELARHFLAQAARNAGVPERHLGEDAIALLQAYDWPGNVRELRNVVERLLIMAPGDPTHPIQADALPPDLGEEAPAVLRWEKSGEIMSMPLREAREMFEREYLVAQINRFGGNVSRTAAFVGMERSALHRKLKSLNVPIEGRGTAPRGDDPATTAGRNEDQ